MNCCLFIFIHYQISSCVDMLNVYSIIITPLTTLRALRFPLLVLNCVGTNDLVRMHKNLGGLDWFRSPLIGIAKLGS
jgi:hypothetical protein